MLAAYRGGVCWSDERQKVNILRLQHEGACRMAGVCFGGVGACLVVGACMKSCI